MYLSRLKLNLKSSAVRRDLGSRYEMHRTLERSLAEIPGRALWRLGTPANRPPEVLVQSASEPDWEKLSGADGQPQYLLSVETRPWDPATSLAEGLVYRFLLEANPTVSKAKDLESRERGKRVGVHGPEAQYEWLNRQAVSSGFELVGCMVRGDSLERFTRAGRQVTLFGVVYEGHLRIKSRPEFLAVLEGGLGRGKSFGFGLLSVAR